MRFSLLLLCFCSLFTSLVFSQSFEGSVRDSVTHQPVPFVHIYNSALQMGTITNEEGNFLFNGNGEKAMEVTISHISFKSKKLTLSQNKVTVVNLVPNIFVLDEITVNDNGYKIARSLFDKFNTRQSVNFGKAYYRQVTITDKTPSEFLEMFNDISFSATGIEKSDIYESRYARSKDSAPEHPAFHYTNFSFLTFGFQLFSLKSKSIVKPFTSDYIDLFDYTVSKHFKNNGFEYVVIQYEPSESIKAPSFSGEFTVNITKLSIVTFTATTTSSLGVDSLKLTKSENSIGVLLAQNHLYEWTFRFNDSMKDTPLESINVVSSFDLTDGSMARKVKTKSSLVVFEKDSKGKKGLKTASINQNDVAEIKKDKYRPGFWKDNPIVKRTRFEEETITYFEKSNSFGNYFAK